MSQSFAIQLDSSKQEESFRRNTLKEVDWHRERSPLDDLLGFTGQEEEVAPCKDYESQDQKDSNVPAITAYTRHQVVDHSRRRSSQKGLAVEAASRSMHKKSKSGNRTAKNYASANHTQLSFGFGHQLTSERVKNTLVSPTAPPQGRNLTLIDQQCREVANQSLKNFYPSNEKLNQDFHQTVQALCSPKMNAINGSKTKKSSSIAHGKKPGGLKSPGIKHGSHQLGKIDLASATHKAFSKVGLPKAGGMSKQLSQSNFKNKNSAKKEPKPPQQASAAQLEAGMNKEWREAQKFAADHGYQLTSKSTYTRVEVAELALCIQSSLSKFDRLLEFERAKSEHDQVALQKAEEKLQKEEAEKQLLKESLSKFQKEFKGADDVIKKLEFCLQALKNVQRETMVCLDFYKDAEKAIQDSRFGDQDGVSVGRKLEELFLFHSLDSLKFDYEHTQLAIEKVNDFLQTKELQKKVFKIDLFQELDKEDQEMIALRHRRHSSTEKAYLPLPVNKKACHACGLVNNVKTHPGPCSLGCGVAVEQRMKIEINQKNQQIHQLTEKLESRVKVILDLKYQLKCEREQEHVKRRHEEYKQAIQKLEKELTESIMKHAKCLQELKKREKEVTASVRLKDRAEEESRTLREDNAALKATIDKQEGFKELEHAVSQLSSFLISKDSSQLTPAQKQLIRAIFGNHSVLQSLRNKIHEYEANETGNSTINVQESSLGGTGHVLQLDITPPSNTKKNTTIESFDKVEVFKEKRQNSKKQNQSLDRKRKKQDHKSPRLFKDQNLLNDSDLQQFENMFQEPTGIFAEKSKEA